MMHSIRMKAKMNLMILVIISLIYAITGCTNKANTILPSEISSVSESAVSQSPIEEPAIIPCVIPQIIEDQIMNSELIQIEEHDYELQYKNVSINRNTKVAEFIDKLGYPVDYEDNHNGFISGGVNYLRWNLQYPNYSDTEIRIIILSEVEGKDSYIVGVYLEKYSTNKGVKVGDELEKVLALYGKPDELIKTTGDVKEWFFLRYSFNNLNLDITLDDDMKVVQSIFIDYKMAESIIAQDLDN